MSYLPQDPNQSNISQTPSQIKRSRIFDNTPSAIRTQNNEDISLSIDRRYNPQQQQPQLQLQQQQQQQFSHSPQLNTSQHKQNSKSYPVAQSQQLPQNQHAQQPYNSFGQSQHSRIEKHYKTNQGLSIKPTQESQHVVSQSQHQSKIKSSPQQQQQLPQQQQQQVNIPYVEQHLCETCPAHKEFVMTNICCNQNCLEPLCPRCIKVHLQYHREYNTPSQIEHIDDKRNDAIQEVQNDKYILEKELELLSHFNEQGKQELIQTCHNKLEESKRKVYRKVDEFFNNFEAELSAKISAHKIVNPGEIKNINPRLIQFIRQLETMETNLKGNAFISELLKVLTGEIGNEYNNIHEDVDEAIDHYIQGLVNLGVNENKLDDIDEALSHYIKIEPYTFDHDQISHKKTHRKQGQGKQVVKPQVMSLQQFSSGKKPEVYQQQQKLSASPSQHQQQFQQQQYQQQQDYYQIFQQQSDVKRSMISNNSQQVVQQAEIEMYDYFDPDCNFQYLHYFQDNSKTIKFIDLKGLSKDQSTKQFKSTELDIKFKIPMYSRSIITPFGDIILTGGLSVENRNQPTSASYVLDYKKTDLKYLPSMHTERSSHGICYMNNQVFVVGGETKDGPTTRCEKFDLTQNKWIELAPLNVPAVDCCICGFKDKYIYKFSGKQDAFTQSSPIERYNAMTDQWEIINFNYQHEFLSNIPNLSQACQINNNEILIMGGIQEHQITSQSLVFRIEDEQDNMGYVYATKPMPREGTFWYNPIIQQNVLFNLINVPIESNPEHSYFGKKTFLAFQGKNWKELA